MATNTKPQLIILIDETKRDALRDYSKDRKVSMGFLVNQLIDRLLAGEIDVMEHKGNDLNKIYGTLHYPKHFGENGNGKTTMIKDVSKYHIYSVEWSEKMIVFFVDGKQYNQIENNETLPFNQNFYFIINLAIGGNFAGAVDPALVNETMEVDYVRVYQ